MSRIKHETIEEKKVISHKDMHGIVLDFGPTQFFSRTSFIAAESNPYKLAKIQKNKNEAEKCITALKNKYGNIKDGITALFAQKKAIVKQNILVRIAGHSGFTFLKSVNTAMGKKNLTKDQAKNLVNLFNEVFDYETAKDMLTAEIKSHAGVKRKNAVIETDNKAKAKTARHESINNYLSDIEKLIKEINPKLFKMHFKKFGPTQLAPFVTALDVHLAVHVVKHAKEKHHHAAAGPAAAEVAVVNADHLKILRQFIDPKKFTDSILDIQNAGEFNQEILELRKNLKILKNKLGIATNEPKKYTKGNKCSPAESWKKMFSPNYGYK